MDFLFATELVLASWIDHFGLLEVARLVIESLGIQFLLGRLPVVGAVFNNSSNVGSCAMQL